MSKEVKRNYRLVVYITSECRMKLESMCREKRTTLSTHTYNLLVESVEKYERKSKTKAITPPILIDKELRQEIKAINEEVKGQKQMSDFEKEMARLELIDEEGK